MRQFGIQLKPGKNERPLGKLDIDGRKWLKEYLIKHTKQIPSGHGALRKLANFLGIPRQRLARTLDEFNLRDLLEDDDDL